MKLLRIVDDHKRLHELGLDQELQKFLGDEWKVEYYHVTNKKMVIQLFPEEKEADVLDWIDIQNDEVFFLWNYFWNEPREGLQKKIKERILDLINQGARIKIQIYTSYGSSCESAEEQKEYVEYFGENIMVDSPETIMYHRGIISDWAEREAKKLKNLYK